MQLMRDHRKREYDEKFVVIGPRGATQMLFLTHGDRPMAADFGYHSPKPMYIDHKPMSECDVLMEVDCYYDGSSLRPQEYLGNFVRGEYDVIYEALEEEYEALFGDR